MQIRLMRPHEQEAVEHIYNTVHPKPEPRRDWGKLTVLVALYEGAVVGYASATWLTDRIWQLVETLVLPEYQGQGIGGDLMEARSALGRLQGAKIAAGGCSDGHAQMRHMLEKQGFKPIPGGRVLLGGPDTQLYIKVLDDV